MSRNARVLDPYRVFFPIGILAAFAGVAVWPLFLAGWIGYPGVSHGFWMIGNFLLAFACGFLLTAVPKFTGTETCSRIELAVAAVFVCAGWFYFAIVPATFALLAVFLGRRFFRRAYSPPPHFVFVGLGVVCGFVGSLGIVLSSHGISLPIQPFRVLFLQGLMLCLVIGVGARLLRVLLGFERSPLVRIDSNIRKKDGDAWFRTEGSFSIAVTFFVLVLGLGFEFFSGYETLARILRASVVGWVAFSAWRLHRLPRGKGILAWGVWASGWSFLAGSVAYPFSGTYSVSVLHLVFVGGFGLTALLVASRVVLAHGGFRVEVERRSHAIAWTAAFALVAGLTRMGAGFSPTGYFSHLGYAAAVWLVAVSIWGVWMIGRLRA